LSILSSQSVDQHGLCAVYDDENDDDDNEVMMMMVKDDYSGCLVNCWVNDWTFMLLFRDADWFINIRRWFVEAVVKPLPLEWRRGSAFGAGGGCGTILDLDEMDSDLEDSVTDSKSSWKSPDNLCDLTKHPHENYW